MIPRQKEVIWMGDILGTHAESRSEAAKPADQKDWSKINTGDQATRNAIAAEERRVKIHGKWHSAVGPAQRPHGQRAGPTARMNHQEFGLRAKGG